MTIVVKELRTLNTAMVNLADKMDRIATVSMTSMVCSVVAASVVSVGLQSIFKNFWISFLGGDLLGEIIHQVNFLMA